MNLINNHHMHLKIIIIIFSFVSFTTSAQSSFESIKSKIQYIDEFKTWRHFVDHFETKEQVESFFGESTVSMSLSNGIPISKVEFKTVSGQNFTAGGVRTTVSYEGVGQDKKNGVETNYFYESYKKSFVPHRNQMQPMSEEEFNKKNPKGLSRTYYFSGFNTFEMSIVFYYSKKYPNLIESWQTSHKLKNISDSRFSKKIKKHFESLEKKYDFKEKTYFN